MPLTPKPNCTIDTNCIIGLEENRDYAPVIRELIAMHDVGQIFLRVVGISASEKQPGGKIATNFALFKKRLQDAGLDKAIVLAPPAYTDITYLDNCYLGAASNQIVEMEIHQTLFGDAPFSFQHFEQTADKSKPNWIWKWRNQKCDTLVYFSHLISGGGLFVTDDDNFTKKKATLLKFSGGDIVKPIDAKMRLLDHTAFAPIPQSVKDYIENPTDDIDPAKVPQEFVCMQANKRKYDERLKQTQQAQPSP